MPRRQQQQRKAHRSPLLGIQKQVPALNRGSSVFMLFYLAPKLLPTRPRGPDPTPNTARPRARIPTAAGVNASAACRPWPTRKFDGPFKSSQRVMQTKGCQDRSEGASDRVRCEHARVCVHKLIRIKRELENEGSVCDSVLASFSFSLSLTMTLTCCVHCVRHPAVVRVSPQCTGGETGVGSLESGTRKTSLFGISNSRGEGVISRGTHCGPLDIASMPEKQARRRLGSVH